MADNRQFSDHSVIGGVNVYHEDKKLAESPSQSSVASTDYFVLKDTDGVPHKIVKADVLEMVRDAMGTILANNNKGTSVAKVPTIGTTDNDFGSSSIADLASVLGGIYAIKYGLARNSLTLNYISGILIVGTTWGGGNIYAIGYNNAVRIGGSAAEVSVSTQEYTTTITGIEFSYFAIVTNQ